MIQILVILITDFNRKLQSDDFFLSKDHTI